MVQKGWSLERPKWQNLLDATRHLRWRKAIFKPTSQGSVGTGAGVYMIASRAPVIGVSEAAAQSGPEKHIHNVLYVGRTTGPGLRSRFMQHLLAPQPSMQELMLCYGGEPLYFYYVEMLDQAAVIRLEAVLIDCYGPPVNRIAGVRARLLEPVDA